MDQTWIGPVIEIPATRRQPATTRRGNPLFRLSLWNCYALTLNEMPRTNNANEVKNLEKFKIKSAYCT